jgi:hypothetical protein
MGAIGGFSGLVSVFIVKILQYFTAVDYATEVIDQLFLKKKSNRLDTVADVLEEAKNTKSQKDVIKSLEDGNVDINDVSTIVNDILVSRKKFNYTCHERFCCYFNFLTPVLNCMYRCCKGSFFMRD